VAREQGLTEQQVAQIQEGYEQTDLSDRDVAALRLTDCLIGDPRSLTPAVLAEVRSQFTEAEAVELALGVSLFQSLSKVLIVLGLEPEEMATTVLPTPGSPGYPGSSA
jgi:alkylhydroperoxidase family enzyme